MKTIEIKFSNHFFVLFLNSIRNHFISISANYDGEIKHIRKQHIKTIFTKTIHTMDRCEQEYDQCVSRIRNSCESLHEVEVLEKALELTLSKLS